MTNMEWVELLIVVLIVFIAVAFIRSVIRYKNRKRTRLK
jgi:hypothetical protein